MCVGREGEGERAAGLQREVDIGGECAFVRTVQSTDYYSPTDPPQRLCHFHPSLSLTLFI